LRQRLRGLLGRPGGDGGAPAPAALLELLEKGPAPPAPLAPSAPSRDAEGALHVATVIPSFRRGSGGHSTIVRLLRGLRERGHTVSVWLEDNEGRHAAESGSLTRRSFKEFFGDDVELHVDLADWAGADVVLATGWQTVPRALLLEDAVTRAYLVQDHEPEFYGASSEAMWAAETYRQGLHCIAASPWLAELLRSRYGASASHFDLAVDHEVYRPPAARPGNGERVVFYARAVTPRRAVPLGLLALDSLSRRRPGVEISLFGESAPLAAPFAHRELGVLPARDLAALYSQATVGVVLSLTNPSLINLEMMASGLPCVELASESMLSTFGADGPLELAGADPRALCRAIEGLLEDDARRDRAHAAGIELASARTWARAAEQVEQGLRVALRKAIGSPDAASQAREGELR
jgi:glycosyltransferase involved in cell wall biosynthesis